MLPKLLCKSLIKQEGRGSAVLPALNIPELVFDS